MNATLTNPFVLSEVEARSATLGRPPLALSAAMSDFAPTVRSNGIGTPSCHYACPRLDASWMQPIEISLDRK
jgi:hypothetical protein